MMALGMSIKKGFNGSTPKRVEEGEYMVQYIVKVILTAILVVAISEAAKRWTLAGAIIASLPLTSLLAIIWLYIDTKNMESIQALSYGIFWMVIPSLAFFLVLPLFSRWGLSFWPSLGVSILTTSVIYTGFFKVIQLLGVKI